uniref:IS66 family insertion sequence element accessory protein TnpA n=1 Tax=Eubacterium cellulosolvens TaxID=29322 RepID=UPI000487D32F|nr:hypothetical protein [[Eubacterium] cellulosolvens]
MNSRQKLHQAQMKEWATRFADQKASGLTVKEWCDQNHFSIHRYHYWKRLLKDEIVDQVLPSPDIVPILLPTAVPAASPSPSDAYNPIALPTDSTSCTTRTSCTSGTTAKIIMNGISIEVNDTVSPEFLATLIKAVRYA